MGRFVVSRTSVGLVLLLCVWFVGAFFLFRSPTVAEYSVSPASPGKRRELLEDATPKANLIVSDRHHHSEAFHSNRSERSFLGSTLAAVSDQCPAVLYTPTFVTKLYDQHMVVDCWHHRVIATDGSVDTPIDQWRDIDTPFAQQHKPMKIPHSVATDGNIIVTESSVGGSDGEGHSLLVYRIEQTSPLLTYRFHQEVPACDVRGSRRPHRVIYDERSRAFYLYLTSPPFLAKFVWDERKEKLLMTYCQSLPFMKGMYARSIVIRNTSLYITAGPNVIWETVMRPDGLGVNRARAYSIKPLGFAKGKMNDLAWIDGWWYATSTVPCAIVRFRSLEALHQHEKIHGQLSLCKAFSRSAERCLGGTPYFVTKIDGRIFVPYIFGCSGVVSFVVDRDTQAISDVRQHWGGGWVETAKNLACRGKEW